MVTRETSLMNQTCLRESGRYGAWFVESPNNKLNVSQACMSLY